MSDLSFRPSPSAAPYLRMLARQTRIETTLQLRNGEQLLLTVVIPLVLLLVLGATDVVDLAVGGDRTASAVAGVLTVAVMSTAFTGLAIATGFERRYGVLRRLAMTPLPRSALLGGKAGSVLVIEALQVVLVVGGGLLLGWSGRANWLGTALLVLLGTLAFAGLGLLMAGTLRAEATLAAANLAYLLLLVAGAAVVPLDRYPAAVQPVVAVLPSAALGEGLRATVVAGDPAPAASLVLLAVWAVAGLGLAARFFRWE